MISTRKKRQSNRRLLSQLDNFDQGKFIGNAIINRQENATVNEITADQGFTVGNSDTNPAVNWKFIKLKTLERCLNDRIDKKWIRLLTLSKTEFKTRF